MTFRGNASLRRALYTFCSPAMQHSFGLQPALCRTPYTRRTNIRKPPVPANIRPSAATGNGLSGTVTAPFQRRGRKRYNTLDFASKIVCQQGAARPYWKPRAKGIASLWTPTFFFTRRYPNCKNTVCHRREENTKGSLCARIVKAQFFLLVLII